MAHVHHFSYGWVTVVGAFAMSVLGSLLGLVCTARARECLRQTDRRRWLVAAAVAIGGNGIWLTHFLAMLGFTVSESDVRYDPLLTVLSAAVAMIVVGAGLFIAGYGTPSAPKVLAGGVLTGVGVAVMHYLGMAAVRLDGYLGYRPDLVLASFLIAVVAATVALWFTVVLRSTVAISIGALVMATATCAMHYTGMTAVQVHLVETAHPVPGEEATTFLLPLVLFAGAMLAGLLYVTLSAPTPDDRAAGALLAAATSAAGSPGHGSTDDAAQANVPIRLAPPIASPGQETLNYFAGRH